MMILINLLAFVLLINQSLSQQDCTPIISSNGTTPSIPQFQSNSVNLAFTGKPQRQNYYNITLKASTISSSPRGYETIVGVTYIENYFDPTALDFAARAIPQPTYFTLLIIMNQLSNWTSIHLHYIVTSRDDIRVGNFVPTNPGLLVFDTSLVNSASGTTSPVNTGIPSSLSTSTTTNSNTTNIRNNGALNTPSSTSASTRPQQNWRQLNISYFFGNDRKWNWNSRFAQCRAYMTGIKYKDRFIDLQIISATVNTTLSVVNVLLNITNQKYSIESLYLGFIVFAQTNTPLAVTIVSSAQNFIEKSLNNFVDNQFVGIIKLNSAKLSTFFTPKRRLLGVGILNAPVQRSQLLNYLDSFQSQAILVQAAATPELGPLSSTTTPSLLSSSYPILQEGTGSGFLKANCTTYDGCIKMGGTFATDQGQVKCIMCRPNSQYSPNTGTCVCIKDYYRDENNNCVGLSLFCQSGQLYFEGACYQLTSRITSTTCQPDQILSVNTKQCICKPGYVSYIGPSGARKCAPPCTNGFIFDVKQQKCLCQPGFVNARGICVQCQGSFSRWNSITKQCQCLSGATIYLGQCYTCGQNSTYSPTQKKCTCNTGYIGNGVVCRKSQNAASEFTIVFSQAANNPRTV